MTAKKLTRSIPTVARTCGHGPELENRANVIRERIGGRVALVRFFAEGLTENVIDVSRNCRVHLRRREKLVRLQLYSNVGLVSRGAFAGPPAGEELVEDCAERINIRGRGLRIAAKLLGAGVVRRQHPVQCPGVFRGVENFRNSEIEKLGLTVRVDDDVRRLQVPVYDEIPVGV